jgi:hypothetical protein
VTEQELRALVRQAVAHHLGARQPTAGPAPTAPGPHVPLPGPPLQRLHPSQALFMLPADPAGACLIEPAVSCTHCGFCKTYGH